MKTYKTSPISDSFFYKDPYFKYKMSKPYLNMKHKQELQTVIEDSNTYPRLIDKLKFSQAKEYQKNLENINYCCLQKGDIYGKINKKINNANNNCYNAQGELTIKYFHEKTNKYNHLKKMSPQSLNKLYNRKSDESIFPNINNNIPNINSNILNINDNIPNINDVYSNTSYNHSKYNFVNCDSKLNKEMKNRHNIIMSEKSKGIMSYDSSNNIYLL